MRSRTSCGRAKKGNCVLEPPCIGPGVPVVSSFDVVWLWLWPLERSRPWSRRRNRIFGIWMW